MRTVIPVIQPTYLLCAYSDASDTDCYNEEAPGLVNVLPVHGWIYEDYDIQADAPHMVPFIGYCDLLDGEPVPSGNEVYMYFVYTADTMLTQVWLHWWYEDDGNGLKWTEWGDTTHYVNKPTLGAAVDAAAKRAYAASKMRAVSPLRRKLTPTT